MRDASRSSRNGVRVAMGRSRRQVIFTRRNAGRVRRSRVVLAPRPWRYVGGKSRRLRGKKGRSPGRARSKPPNHCAGKAGMSWLYLSNPCAPFLPIAHGACGCRRRPAFPAPSVQERANEMQDSGEKHAAGMRVHVSSPSLRAKRSNPALPQKESWIASSRSLSSGARSRDPLAPRNDDGEGHRLHHSTAAPTGGPPGGRCRKVMVRYAPIHDPSAANAT